MNLAKRSNIPEYTLATAPALLRGYFARRGSRGLLRILAVIQPEIEKQGDDDKTRGSEKRDRLPVAVVRKPSPQWNQNARQTAERLLHAHIEPAFAAGDVPRRGLRRMSDDTRDRFTGCARLLLGHVLHVARFLEVGPREENVDEAERGRRESGTVLAESEQRDGADHWADSDSDIGRGGQP